MGKENLHVEERKEKEKDFHGRRESDRLKLDGDSFERIYSNMKFYSVVRKRTEFLSDWMQEHCHGRIALDYCCGNGGVSLELVKHGAFVYGIDISEEAVRSAQRRLGESGLAERCKFAVMDAEHLEFSDDFFDIIVCSGVLHHLDLQYAYPEIARVLKPGGKVICIEALGYNPVIRWYRRRTPHLRTEWEVDHILTLRDVRRGGKYFSRIETRFFHLFSILGVPLRETLLFEPVLTFLEGIDSLILRIPWVQLLAWQMVFVFSGKKNVDMVDQRR